MTRGSVAGTDAQRAADSVRSNGELGRAPTRPAPFASNPLVVDGALAVLFIVVGVATVFGQDIHDDRGVLEDGFREPTASRSC